MKHVIFGESVQGASHKRTDTPCQDSCGYDVLPDGTIILAVADGHGNKDCLYSHFGSRRAIKAFCDVMKYYHNIYSNQPDNYLIFLREEGEIKIAQTIEQLWKKSVLKAHRDSKRDIPEGEDKVTRNAKIYKLYGTTLVGLMITPAFLFAYQLGDGDITYVSSNCTAHEVLTGEKFLGTDTYSLSGIDSWKQAVTCVRRTDNMTSLPHMFLLSTDGFANSHKNEQEFHKTCVDYFEMVKEHGADAVKSNLKKWLDETSEQGCGDDVTVLMAYFSENAE